MSHKTASAPLYVQDEPALMDLVRTLHGQSRVAVDTESNSLYAYRERVCLIQFSTDDQDYLVDPLALPDLHSLAPLFENPSIEKVLHAAEYDLMCLKRDFGFTFANLFDTRVACRTLGWKRNGLRDILLQEFNVRVNKRYQRANWGKRPLDPEMLGYARLDTHYLLPLRDRLAEALRAEGRWQEACELCQYHLAVEAHDDGFDPHGFWRIHAARDFSRRQMAILRELYFFRDQEARRLERPPFKVLRDKVLVDVARCAPQDRKALREQAGLSPAQIRRLGKGLLAAVERGREAPTPTPPSRKRVKEAVQERYDALHTWRKRTARSRKVSSDIILPRDVLWEIAKAAPRDLDALQPLMEPLHWRFRTYGAEMLKVLRG